MGRQYTKIFEMPPKRKIDSETEFGTPKMGRPSLSTERQDGEVVALIKTLRGVYDSSKRIGQANPNVGSSDTLTRCAISDVLIEEKSPIVSRLSTLLDRRHSEYTKKASVLRDTIKERRLDKTMAQVDYRAAYRAAGASSEILKQHKEFLSFAMAEVNFLIHAADSDACVDAMIQKSISELNAFRGSRLMILPNEDSQDGFIEPEQEYVGSASRAGARDSDTE